MISLQLALEVQKELGTSYPISEENDGSLNIDCFTLLTGIHKIKSILGDTDIDGVEVFRCFEDGTENSEQTFGTWTGAIQWVFLELVKWDTARKISDLFLKNKY